VLWQPLARCETEYMGEDDDTRRCGALAVGKWTGTGTTHCRACLADMSARELKLKSPRRGEEKGAQPC